MFHIQEKKDKCKIKILQYCIIIKLKIIKTQVLKNINPRTSGLALICKEIGSFTHFLTTRNS